MSRVLRIRTALLIAIKLARACSYVAGKPVDTDLGADIAETFAGCLRSLTLHSNTLKAGPSRSYLLERRDCSCAGVRLLTLSGLQPYELWQPSPPAHPRHKATPVESSERRG